MRNKKNSETIIKITPNKLKQAFPGYILFSKQEFVIFQCQQLIIRCQKSQIIYNQKFAILFKKFWQFKYVRNKDQSNRNYVEWEVIVKHIIFVYLLFLSFFDKYFHVNSMISWLLLFQSSPNKEFSIVVFQHGQTGILGARLFRIIAVYWKFKFRISINKNFFEVCISSWILAVHLYDEVLGFNSQYKTSAFFGVTKQTRRGFKINCKSVGFKILDEFIQKLTYSFQLSSEQLIPIDNHVADSNSTQDDLCFTSYDLRALLEQVSIILVASEKMCERLRIFAMLSD